MDAVLAKLRDLGGSISLSSTLGRGTTFELRLPLTLAVVPALLIEAGAEAFAVPTSRIAELARGRLEPATGAATAWVHCQEQRLHALDFSELLGANSIQKSLARPYLVVATSGRRFALFVDKLRGRQDVVISQPDWPLGTPRWCTGATILADGKVSLVVDPVGMVSELQ